MYPQDDEKISSHGAKRAANPTTASKTKNSLSTQKTKPAENVTSVKRREVESNVKTVGKSSGKQRAGNEVEKKEFSRIRSKTWEKEEFEARKNVGKSGKKSKDGSEKRRDESDENGKEAKNGEGERKEGRSDESMKSQKISLSNHREKKGDDRDEQKECLLTNENPKEEEEVMNNREQIDADSQDKYSDDFEDYDSDFEEDDDDESVVGMTGNGNVRNREDKERDIDEGKDGMSVVGYEGKDVFSRDNVSENRKGWNKESVKKDEGKEDEEKEVSKRIDSKWRESDLQVNPFSIVDSSRIKRINDLSQLVRLTGITYHVYDSPPLNYDLFIKLFGRKHTKQVETQTKETSEVSSQTDASSFKEKSCQFPNYISNLEGSEDCLESWKERAKLQSDPFKLRLFLLKAEQVINVSLERRYTSATRSKSAKRLLKIPALVQEFCSQFYKLIPPSFHTFSSSSPSSPPSSKLGVVHMAYDSCYLISCQTSREEEREESFICLWLLKSTDKAEHLLRTRTVVTCLLSDDRHTIYAGSSDGSITLWDIRESTCSSSNSFQTLTENPIKSCRGPSFSTACSSIPVTHSTCVTAMSLFKRNEHSNCFPRLCSVDEEGLIILWMLQDSLLQAASSLSFLSSPDLMDGMFPGSRIKLIQETSIRLPGNEFSIKTMVTSSYDPFTLFMGTTSGQVVRVSKFSHQNEPPQVYFEHGEETFSAVTCITFNPKLLTHFLVSFEDGTICLFCEHKSQPLLTWDPSDLQISTVICVQWFPQSATSFAALASSSTIIIWNLSLNLTSPSFKFQMTRY